ncbi:flavodoxin family protein BilS [uncultured Allofournierella sp.]|uniref:flavodoxin family protein BilS n=1 Tax=uncultured Allofournierella sp. TaxID=1940258 RepID=UPI003750C2ED
MKYSIVYSSPTGNTQQLAQAIARRLPAEECLYNGPVDEKALEAPVLFVGFWTDKGSCDAKVAQLLAQAQGKQVYLFGTAGFGKEQEYFQQILARVAQNAPEGVVTGSGFMCQGRMPQAVRSRYEACMEKEPKEPRWPMLIENFDAALSHPDMEDEQAAAQWAANCLGL